VERKTFTIVNKLGFHARAASLFVKTANQFPCDVKVFKNSMVVNGKSIMGLLTLAASPGSNVLIQTDGGFSREALDALGALIKNKFWEEE